MVAGEENFCRGKMRENLYCGRIRLFRWNEKLFKNKVSNSEGLALFKMNSTFRSIVEPQFDEIGNQSPVEIVRNTIVVPFDLSELLAKKRYFGLQVVRNSRQFLSKINEILGQQICDYLFTRFQIDPITILKPNCPKLVIVVEVARSRRIIFNNIKDCNVSKSSYLPPLTIPPEWVSKVARQEEEDDDEDDEEEEEYENDPWDSYDGNIRDYLRSLKSYLGVERDSKTRMPLTRDEPRGFVEISPIKLEKPSKEFDKKVETCTICQHGFVDVDDKKICTTICFHVFHGPCIRSWLLEDNNCCPTCRLVMPVGITELPKV